MRANYETSSSKSYASSSHTSTQLSSSTRSKYEDFPDERRHWTIRLHYLVFIQTFLVAFFVVSIPLLISFAGTNNSDVLSTETARQLANNLADIIQKQAADFVELQVAKIFADTEDLIFQYQRMVKTGLTFPDNYDHLYKIFYEQQKQLGPIQMIYYATESSGNFFGIQSEINPDTNQTIMYLGYALGTSLNATKCTVCPTITNLNTAFYYNIIPSSGLMQQNNITSRYSYIAANQLWYKNARNSTAIRDESVILWTKPYVFGSRDKIGITGSFPFYDANANFHGVMGVDISLESLTSSLQRLSKTENGFIYIITSNGQLLGTSVNETKTRRGSLLNATDVKDRFISTTAKFLNSLVNDTMDFSKLGSYGDYELPDLFFQHKVLKQRPFLVMVTGAPRADYVGDIDRVQERLGINLHSNMLKVIITSMVMFLVLVTLGLLSAWVWIAKPLREISGIMDEASQFDFSSLKKLMDRKPNDNSFIKEFESIQFSFLVMFKKFADAIKNSRELWRDYEESK